MSTGCSDFRTSRSCPQRREGRSGDEGVLHQLLDDGLILGDGELSSFALAFALALVNGALDSLGA